MVALSFVVSGAADVYGAEDAQWRRLHRSTANAGFTGTGFVDYVGLSNEFVRWTVNAAVAGLHTLEFRYALASGNRPLRIDVNDAVVNSAMAFPASGSWTTWRTVSMTAMLNAGVNTIQATSIGSSGGNVDSLTISPAIPVAPPADGVYEAEDATLSGVQVLSVHAGFTGTGFASFTTTANSGQFIEWAVTVPEAGQYTLDYRYALATGNRPLRIDVNGSVANASLAFPASGSWTTWQTVSMTATLNAGANTIRATSIGFRGANIDSLTISPAVEVPPGEDGIFEAENAALSGVTVMSVHAGFTGTGFVSFPLTATSGQSIEWTVSVPDAGLYTLEYRYALATGNRPLQIMVNGGVANPSFGFPASGSWTTWRTVTMTAELNAGTNTIRPPRLVFAGQYRPSEGVAV